MLSKEKVHTADDLMKIISQIKEARIEDGGSGSFYVYLKKK